MATATAIIMTGPTRIAAGSRPASSLRSTWNGIAFGYRDGYWDNGHRWHRWHHHSDYRSYRDRNGSNYHDWNHDRDSNNGWQR